MSREEQYIVVCIFFLLFTTVIILLFAILREVHKINDGDFLTKPINSYGEGIGDAIQGQLVRGQAGISQYDHFK